LVPSCIYRQQFLCSICLDVFTDPVSTPCGHNFCMICIKTCWDDCQQSYCPLCKEKFTKRPELKVNTTLREVVEHFKKKHVLDKPEVLCDVIRPLQPTLYKVLLLLILLKYLQTLSSSYLILSDDVKQVRHGDKKLNLPDNPKRFTNYGNVLGKKGFSSGRFYYEVQVRGKTMWTLGVASESTDRKGESTLCPKNGYWTVILRKGNEYYAGAEYSILLSLKERPQKVGVFVDYDKGLISFYDVEARSLIYSFTGQSFTENLYPLFSPCDIDGGKNSAPLIISPVSNTE
uniref:B30.2/SPRY domain-containing protein n=1 Tax=Astyanax mexicanus TaxID=7994 RepID=A0A8B9HCN6_ASTMX